MHIGDRMKFASLASGSEGNAAFLRTATTRILIDCGLSVKAISTRLAEIGESIDSIDAVIISHEHGDHCSGIARLVRAGMKRGRAIPVYLTRLTAPLIDWQGMEAPPVMHFTPGKSFVIGDIGVGSMSVQHDSVDPCAFTFMAEGRKVGFATDLGWIPDSLRARFRGCDLVMIESNYDEEMLRNCTTRPLAVIERIQSRSGHLSNFEVSDYIAKDLPASARTLILGHLSRDNNKPEIVSGMAAEALGMRDMSLRLVLAEQGNATEVIEL